jgi:hypothetical protein
MIPKTDLPPTDFENLEDSIRQKLIVEILHNMGLIPNDVYFKKYGDNAESFERDYKIWLKKEQKPKKSKK